MGLPLCLVLASAGYHVYGIDINAETNAAIMKGTMPFRQDGGAEMLQAVLAAGRLCMTTDISRVHDSEAVIIVLGTPIDDNMNPNLSLLKRVMKDILPHVREGHLLILRSTVSPGTSEIIREILERETPFRVGKNIFLVFAPERVAQGKSISEIADLPQLIGAFDDRSYGEAQKFFSKFVKNKCLRLTPTEAEIAKLFTNMYRYVQFALANEFFLIAETFCANAHKVIDACRFDYPRFSLPTPGPNVGGPCLYKDGFFLLERFPFPEMITAAFKINEGMTMQIVQKIKQHPGMRKIAILGLTFKADSDDIRNSLSFKLKKQLEYYDYQLVLVDPHIPTAQPISDLAKSDCVILMTPHSAFHDLRLILKTVDNANCLFVDIWGFWPEMRGSSANGYFFAREVSP